MGRAGCAWDLSRMLALDAGESVLGLGYAGCGIRLGYCLGMRDVEMMCGALACGLWMRECDVASDGVALQCGLRDSSIELWDFHPYPPNFW